MNGPDSWVVRIAAYWDPTQRSHDRVGECVAHRICSRSSAQFCEEEQDELTDPDVGHETCSEPFESQEDAAYALAKQGEARPGTILDEVARSERYEEQRCWVQRDAESVLHERQLSPPWVAQEANAPRPCQSSPPWTPRPRPPCKRRKRHPSPPSASKPLRSTRPFLRHLPHCFQPSTRQLPVVASKAPRLTSRDGRSPRPFASSPPPSR